MSIEDDRELSERLAIARGGLFVVPPAPAPTGVSGERARKLLECERWLRLTMKTRPPRSRKSPPIEPTAKQIRCAELIEHYMGLHHAPNTVYECTDAGIEVVFYRGSSFSTFDFDEMTRLTLLAHDMRVRVQVHTQGMHLALMLHARDREGRVSFRHPTIEDALAVHRRIFPEGWHE